MRQRTTEQGFSLVELSIVLVILGLLVGGILAGQSLIRASELRAVTTEQQRYATAISAFKDKYFTIPGDFNTTGFGTTGWIAFGDGDGLVEPNATAASNEASLFWIHLAQAGLVEGSYTNAGSGSHVLGTTFPRSKLNGAGWNAVALGTVSTTATLGAGGSVTVDSTTYFPAAYGNALFFGAGTTVGAPTGVLRAEEAWNVDTKMDDGRPDQGTVLTLESQGAAAGAGGTGCSNPAAAATALTGVAYDLDSTSSTACAFIMKSGY